MTEAIKIEMPPTCSQTFQAPAVLGRNRVPGLGSTVVQVVDAVQIHVLRVPRKGRLPHAEVQVRRVHSCTEREMLDWHKMQFEDGLSRNQLPSPPLHIASQDSFPISGNVPERGLDFCTMSRKGVALWWQNTTGWPA